MKNKDSQSTSKWWQDAQPHHRPIGEQSFRDEYLCKPILVHPAELPNGYTCKEYGNGMYRVKKDTRSATTGNLWYTEATTKDESIHLFYERNNHIES